MRPAQFAGLSLLVGVVFLAGCESQSQWSPTVDTYGNSRAQYLSRDMEECRALARNASGSQAGQTAQGAGAGALIGAAGGALLGFAMGRPGTGAALGAAGGAVGGGVVGSRQTEAQFKRAFSNCMRQRGHNVIN